MTRGFTLVEVLVATGLLAIVSVHCASFFAQATHTLSVKRGPEIDCADLAAAVDIWLLTERARFAQAEGATRATSELGFAIMVGEAVDPESPRRWLRFDRGGCVVYRVVRREDASDERLMPGVPGAKPARRTK